MACFLAPTTAVLIVTAARKRIPSRFHIEWLLTMLWGGVIYLIIEHIYHGEVVWYPPFLTASSARILPEILRVGVPMAVATIGAWMLLVWVIPSVARRKYHVAPITLVMVGIVIMVVADRFFS